MLLLQSIITFLATIAQIDNKIVNKQKAFWIFHNKFIKNILIKEKEMQ